METMYLISFISVVGYGWNILADVTYNRPLSAHVTLGLIAIVSLWQIIPALAIGILIIFISYSGIILAIWTEEKKSKNHADSYRRRKELR